jgi:hypothetical protein
LIRAGVVRGLAMSEPISSGKAAGQSDRNFLVSGSPPDARAA